MFTAWHLPSVDQEVVLPRKLGVVTIIIDQDYGQRLGKLGVFLLLVFGACAKTVVPEPPTRSNPAIELRLPARYQHWRASIEQALDETEQELAALGRWSHRESGLRRHLVICVDVDAATRLYGQLGLGGDPKVARTFPNDRFAIVPLARDDRLLAERKIPPLTLMRSIRHEAAHLLCLDLLGLEDAPLWFLEGLAESLAGKRTDRWFQPELWRVGLAKQVEQMNQEGSEADLPFILRRLPAELMLEARSQMAFLALHADSSGEPWEVLSNWTSFDLLAATGGLPVAFLEPVLRGREFDPPSDAAPMLLCSYPGQVVTALLEGSWDGHYWERNIRIGASGDTEGGLLISGSGRDRIRVRLNRFGGGGSYAEPKYRTWSLPIGNQRLSPGTEGVMVNIRLDDSNEVLEVIVGKELKKYPLDLENLVPPFKVEVWVADGALQISK